MKVTWSDRSVTDLRRIVNFIAKDSPDAAADVAQRIFAEVMRLHTFSRRGRMGGAKGTLELVFLP